MYFEEPFTKWQAWHDLIFLAAYKDTFVFVRGVKVDVKRGQAAVSERMLAERWKWSRGKVNRFLDVLKDVQRIEPQTMPQDKNVITLLSIVNYNKYQDGSTTDETTDRTTNETTNETTNKEVKKSRNIIEKEKYKKEKAFEGFGEDWIKLFNEWLEYKAAKKQGYKTDKSLRAMANQLYELASGDIETARKIVNQSLANNWSGLFALKTVKPSEPDHYKGDDTIGKNFVRRGFKD